MENAINAKDNPPNKQNSPILAIGYYPAVYGYFNVAALHWLDGWNGEGWYDHSNEYGMKQEKIKWWMPLPPPPKE